MRHWIRFPVHFQGNAVGDLSKIRLHSAPHHTGPDEPQSSTQTHSRQTRYPDERFSGLQRRPSATNHISAESNSSIAKDVYASTVLYHGTSSSSKRSIQNHGFDSDLKTPGATAASGVDERSRYHFFSAHKDIASDYARSVDDDPALVRTIGIGRDFELNGHSAQYATAATIDSSYVLDSKNHPAGENAPVFQKLLEVAGLELDDETARALLKEVQSDSDDDFR